MDKEEIKSIIEGLLFTWGDPLSIEDIAIVLEMNSEDLSPIIKELMDELDYNRRGLRIIKINNSYQISTRPEHFKWIKKLNQSDFNKSLSNAALETLSIIAYKQPVIKPDVEAIRGVRCDRAIETLMERKLIEEVGRLDRPGRPIIYGTTDNFLKSFALESIEDLPPLNEDLEKVDNNLDI